MNVPSSQWIAVPVDTLTTVPVDVLTVTTKTSPVVILSVRPDASIIRVSASAEEILEVVSAAFKLQK